jgi:hypothetical protein
MINAATMANPRNSMNSGGINGNGGIRGFCNSKSVVVSLVET